MDRTTVSGAPLVACEVADGVALVRMQDEAGKNALSRELISTLEHVLSELRDRMDVRAIVLAGIPEYFSTGASRALLEEVVTGGIAPRDLLLPRVLLDVTVPLIAAMEGHAISGGLALALCADVLIASRESRYGCNFMEYGFTPGMGTTRLLEYVLGPALAHEMLLTGRMYRGTHFAGRAGFNYVLPRAQVLTKALEMAAHMAEKPRLAITTLKTSLSASKRRIFEEARGVEILMHHLTLAQPEVAQSISDRYGDLL